MITTNYQVYGTSGFNLRLRVYQNGETRYVNVNKLLQGQLSKRHWNQKKQMFTPSAPFSVENNEALVQFKRKYDERAVNWTGNLFNFIKSFESVKTIDKPLISVLFNEFIEEIRKRKHADGTRKGTFRKFIITLNRLKDFCKYNKTKWDSMLIDDCTTEFVNALFEWVEDKREGKGLVNISKDLHAFLAYAEKKDMFDLSKLKHVQWHNTLPASVHKYNTLTPAQCNKLMNLKDGELPKNKRKILFKELCIFLLFTGQSLCDALFLKCSNIETIDGVKHFIFKRRKISDKQSVPCAIPINPIMQKIMDKWKKQTQDDYIFPMCHKRPEAHINFYDEIQYFAKIFNLWLKELGVILGCDFPLHTYTFRHTAITNYISKGLPVIYVANMMGTSVSNCEKIYYNNQGDAKSRDKVLGLTSF